MYSAQLELVHEKLKPGGEHSRYVDALVNIYGAQLLYCLTIFGPIVSICQCDSQAPRPDRVREREALDVRVRAAAVRNDVRELLARAHDGLCGRDRRHDCES